MRIVLGVVFALVGFGLSAFIALFGLLPNPQSFSTPLPIIAVVALLLGIIGVYIVFGRRGSLPPRPTSANGVASNVALESNGPRPIPMVALQILVLVISLPAVVLIMFGLIGTTTPSTSSFAWGMVMTGVALLCGFFLLVGFRGNQGRSGFLDAAHALSAPYHHWHDGGGIAVSPDSGAILLANGGLRRVYEVSDLRSAGFEHTTPGLDATRGIITQAMRAARTNGITLEVRDVDNPRWHIPFKREGDLNRWHEILRTILEG